MSPAISVILPVYNAASFLKDAIDSILSQSFSDFELLIYDDGSTDASRSIINSYQDARIIRHYSDKNQGLIAVLNRGFYEAKGRYIARMDADDICLPDRFLKQITFLESHPDHGICGTQLQLIHNDQIIARPCDDLSLRWWFFKGSPLAHPSVMIRTSVIREHQLTFDANAYVAEDYDLWWRMAFHCKMYNLDEALLKYRVHANQESSAKSDIQADNHKKSLLRLMKELGLESSKLLPEFIDQLLSKNLVSNYKNISNTLLFFDTLISNQNACQFFGQQNLMEEKESTCVYLLQTISKFDFSLLKLMFNNGFTDLLRRAGIKSITFIFKCLIRWKTR